MAMVNSSSLKGGVRAMGEAMPDLLWKPVVSLLSSARANGGSGSAIAGRDALGDLKRTLVLAPVFCSVSTR